MNLAGTMSQAEGKAGTEKLQCEEMGINQEKNGKYGTLKKNMGRGLWNCSRGIEGQTRKGLVEVEKLGSYLKCKRQFKEMGDGIKDLPIKTIQPFQLQGLAGKRGGWSIGVSLETPEKLVMIRLSGLSWDG